MDLRIKLFGAEAAAVGKNEIQIRINPGSTCEHLRERLAAEFPALGPLMAHIRIAVNNEFAADSLTLNSGDELALVGLVSGG